MTAKEAQQPTVLGLNEHCSVTLWTVLSSAQADETMRAIVEEVPLEQRHIVLFGKQVLQPRLVGWAGRESYRYSGQTLTPRPMGPRVSELLATTVELTRHAFNHALINLYRNGNDSMGMHSDDEPELGPAPAVASWSFGQERTIVFAAKHGKQRHRLTLPAGSLLFMSPGTQRDFVHGVPKDKNVSAPRLNVTFRQIGQSNSR